MVDSLAGFNGYGNNGLSYEAASYLGLFNIYIFCING